MRAPSRAASREPHPAPGNGPAGRIDYPGLVEQLDTRGFAVAGPLLDGAQCDRLVEMYPNARLFRSRIVMARHNFGRGEYRYFDYPLPDPVERLRHELYPHLAPVANRWMQAMGRDHRYPPQLTEFLEQCSAAGQRRPTPLLLRYRTGDYNCLHQDLYGDLHFPLQVVILLNRPGTDFEGGELVLTEQRPRMQSRAHVVPLALGEGVVFAVNQRPVRGTRGHYRVTLRHGVAEIRRGRRHALGIIFHDAR